jgi:hypothetical protein
MANTATWGTFAAALALALAGSVAACRDRGQDGGGVFGAEPVVSATEGANIGFSRVGTEVREVARIDPARREIHLRLLDPIQRTAGGREQMLVVGFDELPKLVGVGLRGATLSEGDHVRLTRRNDGTVMTIDLETARKGDDVVDPED